jgi:hypothetical protein
MGIILFFEVESGTKCPYRFTKSQGISLFDYVMEYRNGIGNFPDILGEIEKRFNLNLAPLGKIGLPESEYLLEEFDMDEKRFNQALEEARALWQPPQDLFDCIQSLFKVIHEEPDMFSSLGVSDKYFTTDIFKQDLMDLSKMVEWAQVHGEKKVRLSAA